jgi:rhodanese-related sulfurtransferase
MSENLLEVVAGGLTVGVLGYFVPEVLGVGYTYVERVLAGDLVYWPRREEILLRPIRPVPALFRRDAKRSRKPFRIGRPHLRIDDPRRALAVERVKQLLGGDAAHVDPRLLGHAGRMRARQHIVELQQRMLRRRRLLVPDIEPGAGDALFLQRVVERPFVVDVRTPDEFSAGHLPDAVNIPVDDLRSRLDEFPRDRETAVYCQMGQRGYIATRILRQDGIPAANVGGGYKTFKLFHPAT